MLLTTTINDMLQQALIDAPLWVTFVAPGAFSAIALCIAYALFKGADENRGYKDLLAHSITSICILVAFIFVLFVVTPPVMRAKGFDATTTLLAVAANLASLSLSITIVFGVHVGISKVLHRVATGTYSQPQGDVDTQSA
jgi:nitrate/nitrite transporter NarK